MTDTVHTTGSGGHRFYADEDTGVTLPGVTSILNMIPATFLAKWQAKFVAEEAVRIVELIKTLEPVGAVNYLKEAPNRYKDLRSAIGSEAHDAFEKQIRGLPIGDVPERAMPYVRQFDDFLKRAQPELLFAEDIMWGETHGYAGSADAALIVEINPETKQIDPGNGEKVNLVVDWKTSKSVYPKVALQTSAYGNADYRKTPDGIHLPMPEINGGAVLHVKTQSWRFLSLNISDEVFDYFLACLEFFKHTVKWQAKNWSDKSALENRVVGKPLATSRDGFVTGTERRGK